MEDTFFMLKKLAEIFPVYATWPVWMQIFSQVWLVITGLMIIFAVYFYRIEAKQVLNIMPIQQKSLIPYFKDNTANQMILALNVWPKESKTFEICMINLEVFDIKMQKYLSYAIKVTDRFGKDIEFPVLLKDMKKEEFVFYIPILDKDNPKFKGKLNFIPYNIDNKISIIIDSVRTIDSYQIFLRIGRMKLAFGRSKLNNEGKAEIKFLNKFTKPPAISAGG